MSEWGDEWGGEWGGDGVSSSSPFSDRLLQFVRHGALASIVDIKTQRTEDFVDTCNTLTASFGLDEASGDRLDKIGGILQLDREGASDERYRTLLRIQSLLVLSTTATTPTILRIVELFTGAPPISYAEHYPTAFRIGAIVGSDQQSRLLRLLEKASSATYGIDMIVVSSDHLVMGYTPTSPVDGAGILGYTPTSTVSGAGTLGYGLQAA